MITPEKFSKSCDIVTDFLDTQNIAVAVSGGADSIALLHLCKIWAGHRQHKIIALTIDHNFRKESADEAEKVARWAFEIGIEHHILTNQKTKPKSNIMQAARNIRYGLLTQYCAEHNIAHLMVAHHADDQIETFLMRLERGSGIDGLAAMSEKSLYNNIEILRPLLSFSKQEILDYLQTNNIAWIEDPTNIDLRYNRNLTRNLLENIGEKNSTLLRKRLLNTSQIMRQASVALEYYTQKFLQDGFHLYPQGNAELNFKQFIEQPQEIQLRALSHILPIISGNDSPTRGAKIQTLHSNIIQQSQQIIRGMTLHGCKFTLKNQTIIIIRELL